jgi:uncharacterized protein (DUF342 family)
MVVLCVNVMTTKIIEIKKLTNLIQNNMKATLRIPTRQYAYIEAEFEGTEEEIVSKYFELEEEYSKQQEEINKRKEATMPQEEINKRKEATMPFEADDVGKTAGGPTKEEYLNK